MTAEFPILFAATDDWITLLVFVGISAVSALSNWIKKRQGGSETWNDGLEPEDSAVPPPPPPIAGSRTRTSGDVPAQEPSSKRVPDWEEELRRVLEGAPPPPAPPPIVVQPPPPKPARPPQPQPATQSRTRRPEPVRAPTPIRVPEPEERSAEELERAARRLARLQTADNPYRQASPLSVSIAERLRRAGDRTGNREANKTWGRSVSSPSPFSRSAEHFRTRESLRQAIIASVVLGLPRSLEPEIRRG